MKSQFTKAIALSVLALSVWNCNPSDPEPSPYGDGVYIINEGNYLTNNGSLSYLPRNSNTVATNIFIQANPDLQVGGGLGGGVQDFTMINGKGLLLVDNSAAGQDRVEIVESGTFKSRTTLKTPDIENPRRVIQVGPNKAYVSCWDVSGSYSDGTYFKNPGYIAVIDLNSGTVVKKIPVVQGVEAMVLAGSEVFAGSYSYSGDKTLAIINVETDEVKQRIDFNDAPRPVSLDANGKLWILVGNQMIRMDVAARTIEKQLTLLATPNALAISRDKRSFYYSDNNKTYKFNIDDTAISAAGIVLNRAFNALGVDPQTGRLYGSQYPALYSQAGYVLRYEESGALVDSVRAEISPTGFYFR